MNLTPSLTKRVEEFYQSCLQRKNNGLGYPCAADFDASHVAKFMEFSINNCGDWSEPSNYLLTTFEFEKEVIEYFAQKLKTDLNSVWGYVTNGGSEGNMYGCYLGRERFANSMLYFSEHAHYSVHKIAKLLNLPTCLIDSQGNGEMDYVDLKKKISENIQFNPILFCSIGTTLTGAVDDISVIQCILKALGFRKDQYHLHADAAFSGMILPFVHSPQPFTFEDGIDSISISGQKILGSPIPCGVVLTKKTYLDAIESKVDYINARDVTISGSRNGITPLHLWILIKGTSEEEKAHKIKSCIDLSKAIVDEMKALGIPAWRNKNSLTVVFPAPTKEIWQKHGLATANGLSHIIILGHTLEHQQSLRAAIQDIHFDHLNRTYGVA